MFDVAFALNFKVGRSLRLLTDLERKVVAKSGAPGAHTSPENRPTRPK